MKKIIALALALVMVLGLVACGGNGGNAGSDAATKVSVFWYDEADVYLSTVRAELDKALTAAGIAFDNQYAAKDQAKQLEQVKTAIAGINLGVINLLPLPALDGGHFILLLYEGLRGKPLGAKAMHHIQTIGIAIILAITIFSTFKDITR